jgi:hypothetical protein
MTVTDHTTHDSHEHEHGTGCGHVSVEHEGHIDYLHEGHAHRAHDGHWDECQPAGAEQGERRDS